MPGFDYSKFDKIDVSDSEDEQEAEKASAEREQQKAEVAALVKELPSDLSPNLSLILAARQGQQHLVEALLDSKADVDGKDPHGATALLRAVEGGISYRPVIELLLQRGASLEVASDNGDTPLSRAAQSGSQELLDALLQAGSPSDAGLGVSLCGAAAAGDKGITQVLLAKKSPVNCELDGRLPLTYWAEHGDVEVMRKLLDARANVEAADSSGQTPLLAAAKKATAASVRWLVEVAKAPLRGAASEGGRTPLLEAIERTDGDAVVATLLELGASPEAEEQSSSKIPSPLVAACLAGKDKTASQLLEHKADPNAADAGGRRPLVCAAVAASKKLCEKLLAGGAEVNARGSNGAQSSAGVTALSIAAAANDLGLVNLLLEANADVESTDERGVRPLMTAAKNQNVALCERLLASNASVDAVQEESGKTALIFAAGVGSAEVCSLLIERGAKIEVQATTGAAAIHAAAANGHAEVCRLLISKGADCKVKGPGGQDALALAADHKEVLEVLSSTSQ